MAKDPLHSILQQVEQYCQVKGLPTFYGNVKEPQTTMVRWKDEATADWKGFLKITEQLTSTILIITTLNNELDEDEIKDILDSQDHLPQEVKQEALEYLDTLKKAKGHLVHFTLTFFHSGIGYQFEVTAPWIEIYKELTELVDNYWDEDEPDDSEVSVEYTEDQLLEIARTVVSNERYLKAITAQERNNIAYDLVEKAGVIGNMTAYRIRMLCMRLFDEEIQPARQAEMAQKVKTLKAQGLKKVEIRSRLGISEGVLNSFWYDKS